MLAQRVRPNPGPMYGGMRQGRGSLGQAEGGHSDQGEITSKSHCGNPTLESKQKMNASTNVNVTG